MAMSIEWTVLCCNSNLATGWFSFSSTFFDVQILPLIGFNPRTYTAVDTKIITSIQRIVSITQTLTFAFSDLDLMLKLRP